jgi:Etoposide-induced protein 2.4 (EI24)
MTAPVTAAVAFWRALATCWHPRVLLGSLLPLVLALVLVGAAGVFGWEQALDAVRGGVDHFALGLPVWQWLNSVNLGSMRAWVAPMVVVALAVPLVLVLTLLLVALLATPAVVTRVAARWYPGLEARQGAGWAQSLAWALCCAVAALLALGLSVPLWLVPPLVLVLPPLIWGWLASRVLAFGALARHASAEERRQVMRGRRWALLAIGVACGWLGALPSLIWAAGGAALLFAPFLMLLAVWMYTVVFVFAAGWFAHFCLGELQALRARQAAAPLVIEATP